MEKRGLPKGEEHNPRSLHDYTTTPDPPPLPLTIQSLRWSSCCVETGASIGQLSSSTQQDSANSIAFILYLCLRQLTDRGQETANKGDFCFLVY